MKVSVLTVSNPQDSPATILIPYEEWKLFEKRRAALKKSRQEKEMEDIWKNVFDQIDAIKRGENISISIEEMFENLKSS